MPIRVHADIRHLSQPEFGRVAYAVMDHVFEVHNELGRFLDESIYRDVIAARVGESQTEVLIEVQFDDFLKEYYIDLLVESGAVFEFKAVKAFDASHRAQLLNYLLLTELSHGKLVNLRPDSVEHEFVNTHLRLADRTSFGIDEKNWSDAGSESKRLNRWVVDLLRDIGTGLDVHLYRAAVTHFFGGDDSVVQVIPIVVDGQRIGSQKVHLANPEWAFRVTSITETGCSRFQEHLQRFLNHTTLRGLQWINITRHQVTFTTIET